jgi:hypothetical protein
MNAQLIDAIRQLNLKPGESYTVEVDGRRLVIHEVDAAEPSVYEGQVMMMPWFDSPRQPAGVVKARLSEPSPPDPVIVPEDDAEVSE